MSKRNRVDRVPFELGCASRLTQGLCPCGGEFDWWLFYNG